MILVDTSVWINYFNGVRNWQNDALDDALSENWVLTGDIILAEILQGFDRDSDFHRARQAWTAWSASGWAEKHWH